MTQTQQILRFTRSVTLVTLLSRVFGYARDLLIAVLLGTSLAADAFVIAFRIPNLLRRMLTEGAMTGAFIPVFTGYRERGSQAEAWEFARRAFWTLALVMAGLTLLGLVFAPQLVRAFTLASPAPEQWSLAVLLTRITLPYALLISLTALAGAMLNTVGVFGLPAAVPIVMNLAILAAGLWSWATGRAEPAVALAVGVVLGGVLQVTLQLPSLLRRGFSLKPGLGFKHAGVKRVARLMVPALAGVGIYQVNVLVATAFASTQEGWISALYYANRLTELALGVYAFSVATVVLPVMSKQAVQKNVAALRSTLTFALRNVAFVVVPAAVGLIVLREPIVRLLFQHRAFAASSTELTAWALLFYALGIPAFASVRLVVQSFYAVEDTATPVRVAGLTLGVNIALCFALIAPLGHGGLALATSAASYFNLLALYLIFRRRLGAIEERKLAASLARTVLAAGVMGVGCWWLAAQLALPETAAFAALFAGCLTTIAAGVGLYLILAWLLRSEELSEVRTLVTGRRRETLTGVGAAVPYTNNNSA
ncbi:MAG: murein biosynthesis integral membrane protein MurJ [Terriglobia bacterium]